MTKEIYNSLPETIEVEGEIESGHFIVNGELLNLDLSCRIVNHSPTGFSWGYPGSGPAQLSLSILLKFMPIEDALKFYQLFKFNVVANWPKHNIHLKVNFREEIKNIIGQYALKI